MDKGYRHVLAAIAAHGILNHNTAVDLPDQFSVGKIRELVQPIEYEGTTLEAVLIWLEHRNYLYQYRTHGEVTDYHKREFASGHSVYSITPKGLMLLFGDELV